MVRNNTIASLNGESRKTTPLSMIDCLVRIYKEPGTNKMLCLTKMGGLTSVPSPLMLAGQSLQPSLFGDLKLIKVTRCSMFPILLENIISAIAILQAYQIKASMQYFK